MIKIDQIRALHIELTTRCNARCPMCMRNYRGLEFNAGYPLTELTLEHIQKIFTPEFLKQINLVTFNGNLGDFGLAHDAVEIVNYFLEHTTGSITIETNGSMRTPKWWAQFANPRIRILFALDGLADTHSLYRQDTSWDHVIDNAKAVIAAGGQAVWKFIMFKHNIHQLSQCRRLSEKLGFVEFLQLDCGRNQGPVYTRTGEFSHWLGEAQTVSPGIHDAIEDHLTWFDPKKKIEWIRQDADISCKHINNKEIFVAADGSIYPCCFLGFYPATMSQPGNCQIKPLAQKNNALEHSLEHCLEWFDSVQETWDYPTVAQGRLYACANNCSC